MKQLVRSEAVPLPPERSICLHPEASLRTRVETAIVVIGRCSACEKDVTFDFGFPRTESAIRQLAKKRAAEETP